MSSTASPELASTWAADQMLGNFFLLTCPRLYDLETVTYFGIYRNHHASFAASRSPKPRNSCWISFTTTTGSICVRSRSSTARRTR